MAYVYYLSHANYYDVRVRAVGNSDRSPRSVAHTGRAQCERNAVLLV